MNGKNELCAAASKAAKVLATDAPGKKNIRAKTAKAAKGEIAFALPARYFCQEGGAFHHLRGGAIKDFRLNYFPS